jgi:hypothetical protein
VLQLVTIVRVYFEMDLFFGGRQGGDLYAGVLYQSEPNFAGARAV